MSDTLAYAVAAVALVGCVGLFACWRAVKAELEGVRFTRDDLFRQYDKVCFENERLRDRLRELELAASVWSGNATEKG